MVHIESTATREIPTVATDEVYNLTVQSLLGKHILEEGKS